MLHKYLIIKNIKTSEEIIIHEDENFEELIKENDDWEIISEFFSRQ